MVRGRPTSWKLSTTWCCSARSGGRKTASWCGLARRGSSWGRRGGAPPWAPGRERSAAAGPPRVTAGYEMATRRKKVTLDGSEVSRLSEAVGTLLAVPFSPTDVGVVAGGAAARRRRLGGGAAVGGA